MEGLTRGELAKKAGVNIETISYRLRVTVELKGGKNGEREIVQHRLSILSILRSNLLTGANYISATRS